MFHNFFFGIVHRICWECGASDSGMREKSCCSLTWRDEMRNSQQDQIEKIFFTSCCLSSFFSCPLPTLAHCFVSHPARGIKCKKSIFVCFKECFLHFKMVSHYNQEFGSIQRIFCSSQVWFKLVWKWWLEFLRKNRLRTWKCHLVILSLTREIHIWRLLCAVASNALLFYFVLHFSLSYFPRTVFSIILH